MTSETVTRRHFTKGKQIQSAIGVTRVIFDNSNEGGSVDAIIGLFTCAVHVLQLYTSCTGSAEMLEKVRLRNCNLWDQLQCNC